MLLDMMVNTFLKTLGSFWWVILLVCLISLFKLFKPFLKGKLGERIVRYHAKKYLGEQYILLNDLTLKDNQDGTTQIDHVLISPYGVFVIETKNFQGWIFGGEKQKTWTQKIYKKNFRFQNPLHQNYKHKRVLAEILHDLVDDVHLHSIVVFIADCEFKTPIPHQVFIGRQWTDYVKSFQEVFINPRRMQRIQYRLEKEILDPSWKTHRLHVENLKKRHAEK